MNILPKKSWHVRNRKNIERVKRDEAEAKRLACIEQDRQLRAEQESRIRELNSRIGIKQSNDNQQTESSSRHFNLFEGYEEFQQSANKEHEEEERQLEARQRLQSGIYNRLGRSQDVKEPWYCARDKTLSLSGNRPSTSSGNQHSSALIRHDPMAMVSINRTLESKMTPKHKSILAIECAKTKEKTYSSKLDGNKLSIRAMKQTSDNSDSSPEIVREIIAKKDTLIRKHHKKSKKVKSHESSKSHSKHHTHHRRK